MDILEFVLQVLLGITSLLLTLLILLHKGRGGGLSDMFGGGMSSALGSSGLAERNLNRFTVVLALIWFVAMRSAWCPWSCSPMGPAPTRVPRIAFPPVAIRSPGTW